MMGRPFTSDLVRRKSRWTSEVSHLRCANGYLGVAHSFDRSALEDIRVRQTAACARLSGRGLPSAKLNFDLSA